MVKRILSVFLCAILVTAVFSGCGHKNDISSGPGKQDFPVTIPEGTGSVSIKSEPKGVAVLSPNIADVILALGYEITLKAKSADCTQSDLAVLPNVTAGDAEKIKNLGADLVFTDTALTDDQKSAMNSAGITVLTLKAASGREDLDRLYSQVGSAIKGAKTGYEKGKSMADGILQTIDDITRAIPKSNTPITAVYLYDANGTAATGDTIQGKLIEASGLSNSAAGGKNRQFAVNDLLIADPQYIFCAKGVKEKIETSAELKKLTAVKNKKVYEMDANLMLLQGEQMVNAVGVMAGTVYPQLKGSAPSKNSSTNNASSVSPSSSDFNTNQTLKSGMQSDDVLKMQNRLQELGYMYVKPTGLYAEATQQIVKDFQYLNGMTVTGTADPDTLKKLFSDSAKKRTK